jgi:hypothetical protein
MNPPRYVCIHGHFYQPPRENPWLEAVEIQDSAAPYHDWNERITRECYAPNTRSRLVEGQGKIINLLYNYAWMSFNFGPTLLAWMEQAAPDVLRGLVEADRISRQRHRGHGNALAQVYNHMILPLAAEQDKRTQVLWGIAAFRKHFGRAPEGMWLAETAADSASLEALASAGIKFTILAPRQARRWRRLGERNWIENTGGIDPSRAYLCRLPSGRSLTLFFYDGLIAQQVAFERLLQSGEKFLARLFQGFDSSRTHAQLLHIATDGESYGHHHPFGDMALAYALDRLRQHPDVRLSNYGDYLELHPPEWEVEIWENSSWSCSHGVERWRADCGFKTRSDWHQQYCTARTRLSPAAAGRPACLSSSPWRRSSAAVGEKGLLEGVVIDAAKCLHARSKVNWAYSDNKVFAYVNSSSTWPAVRFPKAGRPCTATTLPTPNGVSSHRSSPTATITAARAARGTTIASSSKSCTRRHEAQAQRQTKSTAYLLLASGQSLHHNPPYDAPPT